MTKRAELNGEVVTIAVDRSRKRVVACTSLGDAAAISSGAPDAALAGLLQSTLRELGADSGSGADLPVRAAFIAGRLFLRAEGFTAEGSVSTLREIDPASQAVVTIHDDPDAVFAGCIVAPAGIEDRLVLIENFTAEGSEILVYSLPDHERRASIRPAYLGHDGRDVYPCVVGMDYDSARRVLYLATVDPDNRDGNGLLALSVDTDACAFGRPTVLLRVQETPYASAIGGFCVNPHDGAAACLMFASEREGVAPIRRVPRKGDLLPVAALHLVGGDATGPRRLDVHGRLGTNFAFLDRERDAKNLPRRFRYQFDFGGAQAEVTPLLARAPSRWLAALFGGTLLHLHSDTSVQSVVAQFDHAITALSAGLTPGTALVGLADGGLYEVELPPAF